MIRGFHHDTEQRPESPGGLTSLAETPQEDPRSRYPRRLVLVHLCVYILDRCQEVLLRNVRRGLSTRRDLICKSTLPANGGEVVQETFCVW